MIWSRTVLLSCAVLALSLAACGVAPAESNFGEATGISKSELRPNVGLSGSRSTPGYYTYPPQQITIQAYPACATSGGIVLVEALNGPNRFTIRDANGMLVVTSGWLGTANFSGPWGMSLPSTNPTSKWLELQFPGTYSLSVETVVPNGGAPDTWQATYSSTSSNCALAGSTSFPALYVVGRYNLLNQNAGNPMTDPTQYGSYAVDFRVNGGPWTRLVSSTLGSYFLVQPIQSNGNYGVRSVMTPQSSNFNANYLDLVELAVVRPDNGADISFGQGKTTSPSAGQWSGFCGRRSPMQFVWTNNNIYLNIDVTNNGDLPQYWYLNRVIGC